jgi:diaminopimelate epimerase
MTGSTSFRKMNGLGNDFVVLDARLTPLALEAAQIAAIADRNHGIGCDQVIALEPSDFADVFMRIWNADGGEVGACGNAARCVAALLVAERGSPHVSIETESGMLAATVGKDGSVIIDMGAPRFDWNEIPLNRPFDDTRAIELPESGESGLGAASMVNVGNPHCIFFVENVESHDLASFGPVLEHDPLFPERANISLAQVTGASSLRLRTWERGAGLTRACGTAACAAAVAAARLGLTGRHVTVTLPGGDLVIDWRDTDDHILMTGPFALDYQGTIPPELLQQETSPSPFQGEGC